MSHMVSGMVAFQNYTFLRIMLWVATYITLFVVSLKIMQSTKISREMKIILPH